MTRRRIFLAGLAAVSALAGAGAAFAAETARASLVDGGLIDGRRVLTLSLELPAGAITYWRFPGEAGIAPELSTQGSRNLADARLRFPTPRRFDKGGSLANGYQGRVELPIEVKAQDPRQPIELKATFDYGLCDKICSPAQARFALTLGPDGRADEAAARLAREASAPERFPAPSTIGAEGPVAIRSVRREAPGRFLVETRGVGDLIVEAPDGYWFDVAATPSGFTLTLAQRPGGANGPTEVVLTGLSPDGRAIEASTRLDLADAP